jgi:CIC family chloride channel protein
LNAGKFDYRETAMDGSEATQTKSVGPLKMLLLSVLIGTVGGLGAVVFRALIALFHNLLFLGRLSLDYNANLHTPASPWGAFVILTPVVGAAGVVFLVQTFAPEAEGHGVPEVMDAIYYHRGVIRPIVAVVKSLASALSIGSGGSVGREGPIVQIGSSFGSTLGQWLRLPVSQRATLIAAGAGSGLAATFNTPIGGVLFAVEIMLHEVSARTLVPVTLATVTATYIGQVCFGTHPSFVIPRLETLYFHLENPLLLLAYVGLGPLLGVVSAIYIRSIYFFEDLFKRWMPRSYYARHLLGMLLVGLILYLLMTATGHYYVEGVGYATIQDILSGSLPVISLLLLLCVLKLLVTSLTLGSGASGGIFSPALYIGTTLGGAYGLILHRLFPALTTDPAAFAVAGMAGVVGGATGAALAAIVMIFEMTRDYSVIIPMTITVALSYGIRKLLSKESIYTMKLVRRGRHMPEALQTNLHQLKRVRELMTTQYVPVSASSTLDELKRMASSATSAAYFLVEDQHRPVGVISRKDVLRDVGRMAMTMTAGEIADRGYMTVPEDATLLELISKMRSTGKYVALVVGDPELHADKADRNGKERGQDGKVQGIITQERIVDALAETDELFID